MCRPLYKIRVLSLFISWSLALFSQIISHSYSFGFVLMMDPLWGLKRWQNEQETVDNLGHEATSEKGFWKIFYEVTELLGCIWDWRSTKNRGSNMKAQIIL